jgi:hypothetical protein
VTQQLERGYWPSYNVPYFEDIYNKSGYPTVLHHFAKQSTASSAAAAAAASAAAAAAGTHPAAKYEYSLPPPPTLVDVMATLSGLKYQTAPRANIFRRDQASVVDLASFQALMRSNDYNNDPLASGDPDKAICIRGDLSSRKSDGGCLDTKVTMGSWVKDGKTAAVNGPTRGGTGPFLRRNATVLPPFTWGSIPASIFCGCPRWTPGEVGV